MLDIPPLYHIFIRENKHNDYCFGQIGHYPNLRNVYSNIATLSINIRTDKIFPSIIFLCGPYLARLNENVLCI